MAKMVDLVFWYDTNDRSINGYVLIGYRSENEYFNGTEEECRQFARDNNMNIYTVLD